MEFVALLFWPCYSYSLEPFFRTANIFPVSIWNFSSKTRLFEKRATSQREPSQKGSLPASFSCLLWLFHVSAEAAIPTATSGTGSEETALPTPPYTCIGGRSGGEVWVNLLRLGILVLMGARAGARSPWAWRTLLGCFSQFFCGASLGLSPRGALTAQLKGNCSPAPCRGGQPAKLHAGWRRGASLSENAPRTFLSFPRQQHSEESL